MEDDESIAEGIYQILEAEGLRVTVARNVEDAFMLFRRSVPNLILLDYLLPDGKPDGFVKEVQSGSSIPIVLVTALANADSIAENLKIQRVLKKPFNIDALISSLDVLNFR